MSTLYDHHFFDKQSFESLRSALVVLPELLSYIRPGSVVDIGCGVGAWLRAAGELGIVERLGVDGDYIDRRSLMIPEDLFLPVDLSRPGLGDTVMARRSTRFDLVMCLEVAEHLPYERSAGFVGDLCRLGDTVLFSAAIPYQHGTGHINEQWPEFWATHFRACGYICLDLLRPMLWERPCVDWWYAQNILLFVREGSDAHGLLPADAVVGSRSLARVHPEAWLSGILNLWYPHRAAARAEEPEDFRTLLQSWGSGARTIPPLRAIERARTALPETRDVFPFTRTEVDNPEYLLAAAEAKVTEAVGRCAAAEAKYNALHAELGTCGAEVEALDTVLSNVRLERDAERDRGDALDVTLSNLRLARNAERDRADGLDATVNNLRLERDAERELGEALGAELDNVRLERDAERDRGDALDATLSNLRLERDTERELGEARGAELGNARLERESLRVGLNHARAELSLMKAKLSALTARAAMLDGANATLRWHIARHEALLNEARRNVPETVRLQNTLAQAEAEVVSLRIENAALLASTSWQVTAPLRMLRQYVFPRSRGPSR